VGFARDSGRCVCCSVLLFNRSVYKLTIRVLDAETGQAFTNAVGYIYVRWTDIPIEKLHIETITSWKKTSLTNVNGSITTPLPTHPTSSFIGFYIEHSGYRPVAISVLEPELDTLQSGQRNFSLPSTAAEGVV
jgi:hypothetical protein